MTELGLQAVPVKLVFFAAARELSGCSESEINLSTPTTAKKLFSEVLNKLPELQKIEKNVMVAINQVYIDDDTNQVSLRAGDEVAFIPPISGG
ncbi:Molybdopterin synthase sulfur carrier subunit [Trinorchestia longiramus]|nr:Molybdopterin synthase sulfur carrier subunit [Trinorchestia longiramus]